MYSQPTPYSRQTDADGQKRKILRKIQEVFSEKFKMEFENFSLDFFFKKIFAIFLFYPHEMKMNH